MPDDVHEWVSFDDPDEEAEVLRQYFLDHLKLPVTLVIERTRFTRTSTGLYQAEWPQNIKYYPFALNLVNCVVVGADGRRRILEWLDEMSERAVAGVIADALGEPAATGPAAPAASAPSSSSTSR